MKSKTILWIQSPRDDNKSILSYNGKRVPNTAKDYQIHFDEVASHENYRKLGSEGNMSLFCAKTQCGLLSFITYSNYEEKDVVGRKIAFLFRVDVQGKFSIKDLESLLNKESLKYGYHVSSNPFDILRRELKKKIIKYIIGSIVVLSFIFLSILFFYNQ